MPENVQLPDDDCLTWWYRAAITGAGTMAALALAIVLFCDEPQSQALSPITANDVIAVPSAGIAFVLLGATTYAIGRGHGIKAAQRRSHDERPR
jgi:hypothetical protein